MLAESKFWNIWASLFGLTVVLLGIFGSGSVKSLVDTGVTKFGYEKLDPVNKTFFELALPDLDNLPFNFETLKGKKATIVFNSASAWGLTAMNISGMNKLEQEFGAKGLEIVMIPSNTFNQEPLTNPQIKDWMKQQSINFDAVARADVNGKNTNEVFAWLRQNSADFYDKASGECALIPWNYAKFLVDANGKVVAYANPITDPTSWRSKIQDLVAM